MHKICACVYLATNLLFHVVECMYNCLHIIGRQCLLIKVYYCKQNRISMSNLKFITKWFNRFCFVKMYWQNVLHSTVNSWFYKQRIQIVVRYLYYDVCRGRGVKIITFLCIYFDIQLAWNFKNYCTFTWYIEKVIFISNCDKKEYLQNYIYHNLMLRVASTAYIFYRLMAL